MSSASEKVKDATQRNTRTQTPGGGGGGGGGSDGDTNDDVSDDTDAEDAPNYGGHVPVDTPLPDVHLCAGP